MTLLEQLYIAILPKYLNKGEGKQVKRDMADIESSAKDLNKTLLAAGASFLVFARKGTEAAARWDRALTMLSVKAGVTRNAFQQMFGEMTRSMAVDTGANRRSIAAGAQQMHSLGGRGAAGRRALRQGAILEAAGVSTAPEIIESGFSLQAIGLGGAADIIDKTTAIAQRNARELRDYFPALTAIASLGAAMDISVDEQLAVLGTLSGKVKSMPEAETQMQAFLAGIMKPSDRVVEAYEARNTGKTFEEFQEMVRDDFGTALDHLFAYFDPKEFASITQERTALQFLTNMQTSMGQYRANVRASRDAEGTVNRIGEDISVSYTVATKRFSEALDGFLESFGIPFMAVMRRVFNLFTAFLDALTRLNNLFFGIPAILVGLTGSLVSLLAGITALRVFMASNFVASLKDAIAPAGKDTSGSKGGSNAVERATLLATILAFAGNMWENIKTGARGGMAALKAGARASSISGLSRQQKRSLGPLASGYNSSWHHAAVMMGLTNTMYPDPDSGDVRWGFAEYPPGKKRSLRDKSIHVALASIVALTRAFLSPIGIIASSMVVLAGLFRWFTRNTQAARDARFEALNRSRLRRHLEEGKGLDDSPPLPGEQDTLDLAREQALARWTAESNYFIDLIGKSIMKIDEMWTGFLLDAFAGLGIDFAPIFDGVHGLALKIWNGIIDIIHSPIAKLDEGWTRFATMMDNVGATVMESWSNQLRWFLGEERPDILDAMPTDGSIHTLPIDKETADALGLTNSSLPGHFNTTPGFSLPGLPIPEIEKMIGQGMTQEEIRQQWLSRSTAPKSTNNISQTFNINGITDPVLIAEEVRRQSVSGLHDALEGAESPVLR